MFQNVRDLGEEENKEAHVLTHVAFLHKYEHKHVCEFRGM
jgi:hypothetical protein